MLIFSRTTSSGSELSERIYTPSDQYIVAYNHYIELPGPTVWQYPLLPTELFEGDNGQCVNYAKALTGLNYFGDAIDWASYINSSEPELKSVVVFDETVNPFGHLATVVEINQDSFIVTERNYQDLWIVSTRSVNFDEPSILGFVKK